ncbi:MAG TPA: methionyl-tRNA formyltransferase [bacterium]|nr:methionyl-tRNA formyltransferase [bacterium]
MRILFAGSPDIAVPSLEAVVASGHTVVAVLTNPPAPRGRGLGMASTPVEMAATRFGLPVLSPERLGPAEREAIAALEPELLVVFAYGKIFGPKFMALFPCGGINAHPSLLPRWRGCAPIPFAIMNRDLVTGVTIQRISPRVDAGDVLKQAPIEMRGIETTETLSALSGILGAKLLCQVLAEIESGSERGVPQDESAVTYSAELSKDDGLVDWNAAASDIDARVRALFPWPLAFTGLGADRLTILESRPYTVEESGNAPGTVISVDKSRGIMVQTGQGLMAILRLQLQGKKAMGFKDFANGARGLVGTRLGAP